MAVRSTIAAQGASEFAVSQRRGPALVLQKLIRRLMPQSFAEWLWWPVFLFCSFLPVRWTPVVDLGVVKVGSSDLLLACFALMLLPFSFAYRRRYPRAFRWTFVPFSLFVAYALCTAVIFGDYRRYDFGYQVFPAVMAWLAMCGAFTLVSSLNKGKLDDFLFRLSGAVAGVALAYSVAAVFNPLGVRPFVEANPLMGIPRVSGPLGAATDLPGVFVIAASYFLCAMTRGAQAATGIALSCILTVAVLLCGSRAGLIALALLALWIVWRGASFKSKVAVVLVIIASAIVFLRFAMPDRYLSFEETYRMHTYETGLRAWTLNAATVVFGHGYGQLWPWYMHDIYLQLGEDRWYQAFVRTPFGMTAYHPHSLYINILAETGLAGTIVFGLALGAQLLPVLRARARATRASVLLPGLLASLAIPVFSTLLLKSFCLSATWWMFFFIMTAYYSVETGVSPRQAGREGNLKTQARLSPRELGALSGESGVLSLHDRGK